MRFRAALVALMLGCVFPLVSNAAPFGGAVSTLRYCLNGGILVEVGPPRGGVFIWSPATQTFSFGPPTHSGQWVLGLTSGATIFCLYSIQPLITEAGVLMGILGTSR